MGNAIRLVPTIVRQNCGPNLGQEAARLVRVLFPENLKRLGRSRMTSISKARQDGGALRALAEMLAEAHALGASPDELLRVIVWLQSLVDTLRKEVDGSVEALQKASIAETMSQSRQDPIQALVTAGGHDAIPKLIDATVDLIAHEHVLLTTLRSVIAA